MKLHGTGFEGLANSSCSILMICFPGTTTRPTYLFKKGIWGLGVPAFSAASLIAASEGGRYSCVSARMMLHSYTFVSYQEDRTRKNQFTHSICALHLTHEYSIVARVNPKSFAEIL